MLIYSTPQEYANNLVAVKPGVLQVEDLIKDIILDPFKKNFEDAVEDFEKSTNTKLKIDLSKSEYVYKLLSTLVYDYDINNALPQPSAGYSDTLRQYAVRIFAEGLSATDNLSLPERVDTLEQVTDFVVYAVHDGKNVFDIVDDTVLKCKDILISKSTEINNLNSILYSYTVIYDQYKKRI